TLVTIGSSQQQIVKLANIYIKISTVEERSVSQSDLMLRARSEIVGKYLKEVPQLRTSVNPVAAISGRGQRNADINFVVSGPDLDQLTTYSDHLLGKLKSLPDVVDVDSTLVTGKPELRVVIDRARAADLALRISAVAQSL